MQELRVVATTRKTAHYRVMITLVQAATRDTVANGTVTFKVEGQQGKAPPVLPLSEIEIDKRKQFPVLAALFPADRGSDRAAAGFQARAPPCRIPARAQSRAIQADLRMAGGRRRDAVALTP